MPQKGRNPGRPADPQSSQWTATDVEKILVNPAYVGIAPYPATVPEDLWLKAQERLVKQNGAIEAVTNTRALILQQWPTCRLVAGDAWIAETAAAIGREGVVPVYRRIIAGLREEFGTTPGQP